MNIRIIPFIINTVHDFRTIEDTEEQIKKNDSPITYWGIYLDDKQVSYTSSEELAEKAKLWIERWLSDRS